MNKTKQKVQSLFVLLSSGAKKKKKERIVPLSSSCRRVHWVLPMSAPNSKQFTPELDRGRGGKPLPGLMSHNSCGSIQMVESEFGVNVKAMNPSSLVLKVQLDVCCCRWFDDERNILFCHTCSSRISFWPHLDQARFQCNILYCFGILLRSSPVLGSAFTAPHQAWHKYCSKYLVWKKFRKWSFKNK